MATTGSSFTCRNSAPATTTKSRLRTVMKRP
nr:MAG TPA: hypothetical protein [Bacteriophage sp.]